MKLQSGHASVVVAAVVSVAAIFNPFLILYARRCCGMPSLCFHRDRYMEYHIGIHRNAPIFTHKRFQIERDGFFDIIKRIVKRFTLRVTARQCRRFYPIAALFGFVNYDRVIHNNHSRSSNSDTQRSNSAAGSPVSRRTRMEVSIPKRRVMRLLTERLNVKRGVFGAEFAAQRR